MMIRTSSVLFLCLLGSIWAGEIDNHLVGDPIVDCQDTMVSLTFTTEKPFNGRVYIKGLSDDDRCSRNFATNQDQTKFSMMIQNGDCNMQRQRMAGGNELEGIVFSLTIVVSFHGTFVTKVDRAYRCMCFFRNIKRVTNYLDMSMLGTTEIIDTAKMPTCTYTIHSGSADGPLIRYAKVGDKIYHVWQCDDDKQGFLVHSCWVNDGRGNRFDLLDIDGCAIDPIIQPDVKYENSLTRASVETHGYKFSDTSVLDYMCVLELCKIAQGECNGLTPPACGRGRKKRNAANLLLMKADNRALNAHNDNDEGRSTYDVSTNLNILDTLDADLGLAGPPNQLLTDLNTQAIGGGRPSVGSAFQGDGVCMSSTTMSTIAAVTILALLTSLIAGALICMRRPYSHRI